MRNASADQLFSLLGSYQNQSRSSRSSPLNFSGKQKMKINLENLLRRSTKREGVGAQKFSILYKLYSACARTIKIWRSDDFDNFSLGQSNSSVMRSASPAAYLAQLTTQLNCLFYLLSFYCTPPPTPPRQLWNSRHLSAMGITVIETGSWLILRHTIRQKLNAFYVPTTTTVLRTDNPKGKDREKQIEFENLQKELGKCTTNDTKKNSVEALPCRKASYFSSGEVPHNSWSRVPARIWWTLGVQWKQISLNSTYKRTIGHRLYCSNNDAAKSNIKQRTRFTAV